MEPTAYLAEGKIDAVKKFMDLLTYSIKNVKKSHRVD